VFFEKHQRFVRRHSDDIRKTGQEFECHTRFDIWGEQQDGDAAASHSHGSSHVSPGEK
jgi:hypothetical protein